MKTCTKCKTEKPLNEFYAKSTQCKPCYRARVTANRRKNIEYYREYDRKRANQPHRVQARKEYGETEQGKQKTNEGKRRYIQRFPVKRKAHILTGNAIRNGKLIRPNCCEACGTDSDLHAHHDDYSKPLVVRWLCDPCHNEWHKNNEPLSGGDPVIPFKYEAYTEKGHAA